MRTSVLRSDVSIGLRGRTRRRPHRTRSRALPDLDGVRIYMGGVIEMGSQQLRPPSLTSSTAEGLAVVR